MRAGDADVGTRMEDAERPSDRLIGGRDGDDRVDRRTPVDASMKIERIRADDEPHPPAPVPFPDGVGPRFSAAGQDGNQTSMGR